MERFSSMLDKINPTLIIFTDEKTVDPVKNKSHLLPKKLKYIFMESKLSKDMQKQLSIDKLPKMRLYYNHPKLYSEFSMSFNYLKGPNGMFEIIEFLKRKLQKSFFTFEKDKKMSEKVMRLASKSGKAHFLFVLQKYLPFCEDTSVFKTKRKHLKMMKEFFLVLSRVMSPISSLYVTDTNKLKKYKLEFDGVLMSRNEDKNETVREIKWFGENLERNKNANDYNGESDTDNWICNGLFIFDSVQREYKMMSLERYLNGSIEKNVFVLEVRRVYNQLQNQVFPKFKPRKLSSIWDQSILRSNKQLSSYHPGKIILINEEFMNMYLSSETKKNLLLSMKSTKENEKTGIYSQSKIFILDSNDEFYQSKYERLLGFNFRDYYMYYVDSSNANSRDSIMKFRYLKGLSMESKEINKQDMSIDLTPKEFLIKIQNKKIEPFKISKNYQEYKEISLNQISECEENQKCPDRKLCPGNKLIQKNGVYEISSRMFNESVIQSVSNSVVYLYDSCITLNELSVLEIIRLHNSNLNVYLFDVAYNEHEKIDFNVQFGEKRILLFVGERKGPTVVNLEKMMSKIKSLDFREKLAQKIVGLVRNLEKKKISAEDI